MGLKDIFPEFEKFEEGVADELRAQRRRAGVSLKDMAEKIGLHPNTIAKCERHEFGIGLEILYGYARTLDRSMPSFLKQGEPIERMEGNPIAELDQEEMVLYSQLLQSLFNVFAEQGIKLSGGSSLDATRLVAMAIIEKRDT